MGALVETSLDSASPQHLSHRYVLHESGQLNNCTLRLSMKVSAVAIHVCIFIGTQRVCRHMAVDTPKTTFGLQQSRCAQHALLSTVTCAGKPGGISSQQMQYTGAVFAVPIAVFDDCLSLCSLLSKCASAEAFVQSQDQPPLAIATIDFSLGQLPKSY